MDCRFAIASVLYLWFTLSEVGYNLPTNILFYRTIFEK
jgi:hypothetical protein